MPMIRYEPRLLAEVSYPLLGGALRTRYHIESEVLYAKYPAEHRAEAFAALDGRTFRALPQHDVFEKALRDAGSLPGVQELRVYGALGDEEGADLSPSADTASLRVCLRRVRGDLGELRAFLLHELTHLVDLLDAGFGYRREDPALGERRPRAELVRDRYRVLWNASVDGRLALREETVPGTEEIRRNEVRRALAAIGGAAADRLFEDAWTGRLFGHAALLTAARRRGAGKSRGLQPGGTCPLCSFSTWDVASIDDAAAVATAVRADYSTWAPDEGLCGRCLELYQIHSEDGTWRFAEETC